MNQTSLNQMPITVPVLITLTNVSVKRKLFTNLYTVDLDEEFLMNASLIEEISVDKFDTVDGGAAKTTCIYLRGGDHYEVAESPSRIIELISESFRENYQQNNS